MLERAVALNPYARIEGLLGSDTCVVLDGAIGSELIRMTGKPPADAEFLWGVTAIAEDPAAVQAVHRRYIEAGCDVISTNTWGLPTALQHGVSLPGTGGRPAHWMDVARSGVGLARSAAQAAGREQEVAVAFSLNGDIDTSEGAETIRLLARAFESGAPDLILLETLTLVRDTTFATVQSLLDIGLPVWLSFRRCRHGVCGAYGEHWGGPEGDAFGRVVRRLEELGVAAVSVNCVPPDHVPGMLSWLRDFTDLPLGVYPNLGYLSAKGWSSDTGVGEAEYAELARGWRDEGAQIIGGCCGVGSEHVASAARAVAGMPAGRRRDPGAGSPATEPPATRRRPPEWRDRRGRDLFPLPLPDVRVDPGVFVPTQGSFLVWKHLFNEQIGAHQRCLDVGCGTGLLSVQLALNGAAHVHAMDIDEAAVANTLTNAFRNGVSDRVTAEAIDLFPWVPEERYDVIVASLYQMPVDPFEQTATHRRLDYWGRNLIERLLGLLPEALRPDGTAYLMLLSIVGHEEIAARLDELGYAARVLDFGFFEFSDVFRARAEQIERVETLSDAYHHKLGDQDVMVAYLLEVSRAGS